MAKAKTMNERTLAAFLGWVEDNHIDPDVMLVVFMLSYYQGLRVQEIAGLRWDKHIFDNPGEFRTREFPKYENGHPQFTSGGKLIHETVPCIEIVGDISKYTGERTLPLHPKLAEALLHLWRQDRADYVVPSGNSRGNQRLKARAHALLMRMKRVYIACPFTDSDGYKSHSGRRSFGTRSAQRVNADHCSLRDTQALMGHANVRTTQEYVDISPNHAEHIGRIWG